MAVLSARNAVAAPDGSGIRPFRVRFPERDLVDLARRVRATRWPDRETVPDQTQGVPRATLLRLADYWTSRYDWRRVEARLNALPQFMTAIDGLDIHFIHVRSRHDNALPLIVTHGWPGSVIEQLKIVGPLTDPTAHGGSTADAFHLVIPSIPGHGFSGKPTTVGWNPDRIARAWTELMVNRLGYNRFVAQGGDWGALITDRMAVQAPPALIGMHTNLPGAVPPAYDSAIRAGAMPPAGLPADENAAWLQLSDLYSRHVAYARFMGTRPQTLAGLADTPVGLAAFMLDHDVRSLDLIAAAFAGHPGGLSRDDVLDNITLYWLTNTAVSAARLYWENPDSVVAAKGVRVPAAVSVFPDEVYQAPRGWVEKAYPNLLRYNRVAKGGHFAAWEQPQLFAEELRAGFRPLR
ncbi:pimeloyl-ACP methyl ester carboxylesterase [Kutzneria kofuensis]|uniref:Pimeloyl-ACP methyl ester carboxylesterase n=1 Tax=Kutzneria kofuensis TaxID=103725 RepID=A0A7W9KMU9_9PSEU|nr:epoxide hydrolase [Kutzneria kofuensis]MBB5895451.1 pimeloyl-ACP methyl ester carboxylesterase [Kutzneria kofuensis]